MLKLRAYLLLRSAIRPRTDLPLALNSWCKKTQTQFEFPVVLVHHLRFCKVPSLSQEGYIGVTLRKIFPGIWKAFTGIISCKATLKGVCESRKVNLWRPKDFRRSDDLQKCAE